MQLFGENGIITNAQNANMLSGMAVLEEFLQEKYVENYDIESSSSGVVSKIDVLRIKYPEWFYQPTNVTGLTYILNKGNVYYLIQKDELPKDIGEQLVGGNAGDKTYASYSAFQDVYGVTSDLKVYYCSDGLLSAIGKIEELKDNPNRVAINSSSGLASYLRDEFEWVKTDESGNLLAENLDSIRNLTLNSTTMDNLSDIYNFSSLEKLEIINATISSLKGIGTSSLLNEIYIENSTVGDLETVGDAPNLLKVTAKNSMIDNFSGLSNSKSLESLMIDNSADSEVAAKIGNGLKNSKITTLHYLGLYNSRKVVNIDGLNNISSVTKNSVLYLYLYNNGCVEATINEGFSSTKSLSIYGSLCKVWNINSMSELTRLEVGRTFEPGAIESLNIDDCPKLAWLSCMECPSLKNISITPNTSLFECYFNKGAGIENVDFLKGNNTISIFEATNCQSLKSLEGFRDNTSLMRLLLENCGIGDGRDTSKTTTDELTNYSHLGKSDNATLSNVLAPLGNNSNLSYFNARNCKSLGYISYLMNCPLKNLWLEGCENIVGTEFSETNMKNKISAITSKGLPSFVTLSFLDANTTSVTIQKDTDIRVDEFESLADLSKLSVLMIYPGCRLVDSNGYEIPLSSYDEIINNTLRGLSSLERVALPFSGLTEISFVTQTVPSKIKQLALLGTKVGTHTEKVNGLFTDSKKYQNGLLLLNNYCPNLKNLALSGAAIIDFTEIQTALNKLDDKDFIGTNFRFRPRWDNGIIYRSCN